MINKVLMDELKGQVRWVAHLDLLGVCSLIQSEHWYKVFSIYARSIDDFQKGTFGDHLLTRMTFSDSFVVYSTDESALSYRALDSFIRHFVVRLITQDIPVRGAISCGYFYSDIPNSLFFGQALVEAHRVGESLDWIGLVLTESAAARLDELGLSVDERINYAYWDIPMKQSRLYDQPITQSLPAFILGEGPSESGQRRCRDAHRMKNAIQEDYIRRKYENSLRFLASNVRG